MQEDVGIIFVVEVQDSIISRAKLPYVIFQMLGDVLAQPSSMILEQLYVLDYLFMLYSCVFIRCGFLLQVIEKVPQFRDAISGRVKLNGEHGPSPLSCSRI